MSQCLVCAHRFRADIDVALLQGVPLRKLGKQYGPSRSSMQRHKDDHLPGRIREDAEKVGALEPGSEPNLWDALTELDEDYARVAKKAERSKQYAASVSAIKERRSIAELKGRVRGEVLPQPPGGDTNINVFAADADAGVRIAKAFIERRAAASLAAGPVVDTELVDEDEPGQGDA